MILKLREILLIIKKFNHQLVMKFVLLFEIFGVQLLMDAGENLFNKY